MNDKIDHWLSIPKDIPGPISISANKLYKLTKTEGPDAGSFSIMGRMLTGKPKNGCIVLFDVLHEEEFVKINVNYDGGQRVSVENCTSRDHTFGFINDIRVDKVLPEDMLVVDPMKFTISWCFYSKAEGRFKMVIVEIDPIPEEHAILVQYSIANTK